MPGYKLPGPGTRLGPCLPDCDHRDCALTGLQAASLCRECKEPIGYERRFFFLTHEVLEHVLCGRPAEPPTP